MNNVNLLGRITKQLEYNLVRDTGYTAFSLAVNRDKKGESDFIRCIAFGKTAETLCQYLNKGDQIAVNGRIQTGSYEKDGKKVYTTDVIVNRFWFTAKTKTEYTQDETDHDEELPF